MFLKLLKSLLFFIFVSSLVSCGGGGSKSSVTNGSITLDRTFVTATAAGGEYTYEKISIGIRDVPEDGLYVGVAIEQENSSIEYADFNQISEDEGALTIAFVPGATLGTGTYNNTLALVICLDEQCERPLDGSPFIIKTELIFEETIISSNQSSISVKATTYDNIKPEKVSIPINVTVSDANDLYISVEQGSGVSYSSDDTGDIIGHYEVITPEIINFDFDFGEPVNTPFGLNYSPDFKLKVCYDYLCSFQVTGSPYQVEVTYEVSNQPSDIDSISPDKRTQLLHNTVDAEYSSSLNAIVIASSTPRNSLYIYDMDSSTVEEILLDLPPSSLSIANAGKSNKIAVGHEARITFIEYDKNSPELSTQKSLGVPTNIYDLVATDDAIYAVPNIGQWVNLYRVNILDNSYLEASGFSIRDKSIIKLHPVQKSLYVLDTEVNSGLPEKINISVTPPTYLYQSDFNNPESCKRLWISNDGKKIYTGCGNIFTSSSNESKDLIFTNKLPLSYIVDNRGFSEKNYFEIISLSESSIINEVAIVEVENSYDEVLCSIRYSCLYNLSFYNKNSLVHMNSYSFGKLKVNSIDYNEKPEYVFYDSEKTKAYVITTLKDFPSDISYILEVQR